MGTSAGMWLSSRCSFSLWSYSRLVARLAPVGDDVDLAFVARLLDEPQRRLVELYALLPELERAVHPRDERGGDDRPDEEQGDHYAVGTLYLVRHERVDEHDRDQPEGDRPITSSPRARHESVTAKAAEDIIASTPVA